MCWAAIFALAWATQSAPGLVNQDIDQVLAEYGRPVSVSGSDRPSFTFFAGDIKIVVTFLNGISQCENYIPIGRDLAAEEIVELLKRNGRNSTFTMNRELSGPNRDVWETADGFLIAYAPKAGPNRGCLVATRNYISSRTEPSTGER